MRIFRAILSVVLLLFLILSPGWLMKNLAVDHYRSFYEKPAASWHGKIEIWHIVSFRTYQGSVTKHLRERATKWNDKHAGVHIEVIGMTEQRYRERIARGETPDAYSFASGLCYLEQLSPMDIALPAFSGSIPIAEENGSIYAVPYLYSAYFAIGNAERLATAGLTLPETIDDAFLSAVMATPAKSSPLCADPILAARANLTGALATQADFKSGSTMLCIGDARLLGDLLRSDKLQLSLEIGACGGYTDQVQYLGISKNTDEKRKNCLIAFFTELLCQKEQELLPSLGAFPVLKNAENIIYTEDFLSEQYALCDQVAAPLPFPYQRHKEALEADAREALEGENYAKNAFWQRMDVVMFTEN